MRSVAFALLLCLLILVGGFYLAITRFGDRLRQSSPDVAAVRAFVANEDSPLGSDPTRRAFVVTPGETASEIADNLERSGFIRSALQFRLAAREEGVDGLFEAGEYQLSASMRPSEIRRALLSGRNRPLRFTIPEGHRLTQIADAFDELRPGTRGEFVSIASAARFAHPFLRDRPSSASLEGYLFPDTYELDREASPLQTITRMLDAFGGRVSEDLIRRAGARGLNIHQMVTLASIVEREAQLASERETIAGVFLARLKLGMPLQADPTVQYAIASGMERLPGGYWKRELSAADLAFASPYNTYQVRGLPPGPIASPGVASVEAVVTARDTDLLYFVARPDGSHLFARTLAEHNANVARTRSEGR